MSDEPQDEPTDPSNEELALFQSQLLDAVRQPVVVSDMESRVIFWNQACEEQYGWTREEALGRDVMEFLSTGDIETESDSIEDTVRDDVTWAGEMELRRKDGSVFPAMCTASPIVGPEGDLIAVLGIATDLTDAKKTEVALRERVKELRTLYRASKLMNRQDISVEERLSELVQVIPAGWFRPEITEVRITLGGSVVSSPGFRETPWMQSASIRTDEQERGRIDIALVEDPQESAAAFLEEEQSLLESLARTVGEAVERSRLTRLLSQTFANLDEAIIIAASREEGRHIIDVNPATERIFGYSRDELVGGTSEPLHVDRATYERFAAEAGPVLEESGVFIASYPLRRKDGTMLAVEQTVTLLDPERGEAGGVVSVLRDVSARVELEQKLHQSQKMEAVGRLAGGIAHDFNNLLTVIQVQVDLMLSDAEPDSEVAEDLRIIQDTTDRASELTGQLLAFSREQILRPRIVDLGAVVEGTLPMVSRLVGEDVVIEVERASDAPFVNVDAAQLEQVILNLAANARDAMPEGGFLTISTSKRTLERDEGLEPGDYVALRISDTGQGIDTDAKGKLFEPFYSTKSHGKGTGLGLAMTYGFVRQSGGAIRVESEPGEGATFELLFPVAAGEPERVADTTRTDDRPAAEVGRVWLIEDNPDVRRVATRLLERNGFDVDAFEDAEAAAAAASMLHGVDVVLTDLVLPGMSGPELIQTLRDVRPDLPVVAMSGYSQGDADRRRLPADVEFVRKPFTPGRLLAALQRTLVT